MGVRPSQASSSRRASVSAAIPGHSIDSTVAIGILPRICIRTTGTVSLLPTNVIGVISGWAFGFSFGLGGIGAAALGELAEIGGEGLLLFQREVLAADVREVLRLVGAAAADHADGRTLLGA